MERCTIAEGLESIDFVERLTRLQITISIDYAWRLLAKQP